jgi:nucleotide-binding universal stress UspA family protein
MGAFGGNRLRDWLLGSTTRTIVNTCPVPLFVYH